LAIAPARAAIVSVAGGFDDATGAPVAGVVAGAGVDVAGGSAESASARDEAGPLRGGKMIPLRLPVDTMRSLSS
jgi:hypothetical protein